MVRMTVNVTVNDMVRSTCKGTVKCMVVKGIVRGTVISTIKGIATNKVTMLVVCERIRRIENNRTSLYTHPALFIRQSQRYVAVRRRRWFNVSSLVLVAILARRTLTRRQ